ncbi:hypothetical protein BDV33DRAFT_205057 [Aspergillus novoparasiticus]|uniref:Rhodopsin domain-containing protein n=1 Tax=Aspergillus novoparasiticus TaxID=986946 RepID=A0A5N6EQY4_9EURO|nr:hypothetical protein BDV33DRAFT_205057 [Aspergillus novoparasiticus]
MAPQDSAGRIHKQDFIVSISVLLAPAILGVFARFFIRLRIQRQRPSVDDWLLLVALGFLLASIIIMYIEVVDRMYLVFALSKGMRGVSIPSDIVEVAYLFHLWSDVCLLISWCAFSAVKLSFLFFFRKLIDRMRTWQLYWWAILIYTVCVLIYGSLIFFVSCPYFFDPRENQCSTGSNKRVIVSESIALAVLDTVGDILILAIPINIIWKIRVRWPQKVLLTCSLCLTVIMIALSIVRVCGLENGDMIDTIWETYWQFLSAEVGVFLAAAVSFRSLFVAHKTHAPAHYSVKKFLKDSLQSAKRRDPLTSTDCWLEMPESDMEALSNPNNAALGTGITFDGKGVTDLRSESPLGLEANPASVFPKGNF